jgi:glycosyltransferase involved in cell wall biosynthesis
MPSLDEGFGLPVLEALACGSPLVATRAGNIADLAGDAALLVPPADADALAAALTTVVGGGAPAGMRERGLRRAGEFSWKRAAEETLHVYRSVATGHRGRV